MSATLTYLSLCLHIALTADMADMAHAIHNLQPKYTIFLLEESIATLLCLHFTVDLLATDLSTSVQGRLNKSVHDAQVFVASMPQLRPNDVDISNITRRKELHVYRPVDE